MDIIKCPWDKKFISILKKVGKEIVIVTPFLSKFGTDLLKANLKKESKIVLITNLSHRNTFGGGTDLTAILDIYEFFGNIEVRTLSNLHAKIYLFDNDKVLVTSGNFSEGGLVNHYEYGMYFNEDEIVSQISKDVKFIILQSSYVPKEGISGLAKLANEAVKQTKINMAKQKKYNEILKRYLKKQIEVKIESSKDKTVHAVFKESILVLLKEYGSMTTRELNPRIQQMHPELCDDLVDRVIKNKHFGKKWKHDVRGAQVGLTRNGVIERQKDGKWHLKH